MNRALSFCDPIRSSNDFVEILASLFLLQLYQYGDVRVKAYEESPAACSSFESFRYVTHYNERTRHFAVM